MIKKNTMSLIFLLLHFIHFQNTKYSGFDHNEWTETQFESIPQIVGLHYAGQSIACEFNSRRGYECGSQFEIESEH